MKKLKENNIWNKFFLGNIIACLVSTICIAITGRATKFDVLVICVLFYFMILRIIIIKDVNKNQKHRR